MCCKIQVLWQDTIILSSPCSQHTLVTFPEVLLPRKVDLGLELILWTQVPISFPSASSNFETMPSQDGGMVLLAWAFWRSFAHRFWVLTWLHSSYFGSGLHSRQAPHSIVTLLQLPWEARWPVTQGSSRNLTIPLPPEPVTQPDLKSSGVSQTVWRRKLFYI